MDLERIFEDAFPADYDHSMQRTRPYVGQPHTDQGERGKHLVAGLTMRDICDCYVRGLFLSCGPDYPAHYEQARNGEKAALCYNDMFDIDLSKLDPMAVMQNMMCEVEKMMGVFPNIPETTGDANDE